MLKQSYKNIEVIVVDDGSKDGTKTLVSTYVERDSRIKYIYKENSGVAAARNVGIDNSTGDFIAFLDGDDLWIEDKIKLQVDRLSNSHSKACYCGYYYWFYKENREEIVPVEYNRGYILEQYINGKTWPQTSTWLIDSELIKRKGLKFTEGCNWGEDFEFIAKVIALAEVEFVEGNYVKYRVGSEGSLSKFSIRYLEVMKVWERVAKWLKEQKDRKFDAAIEYILTYRIPVDTAGTIWKIIKEKELYKECKDFYIKNNVDKYLRNMKYLSTLKDFKEFIKSRVILIGFKFSIFDKIIK